MALNVNRKVDDPFYRYKMPKLEAKIEGSGNGIKTVIPNMVEIARSLERPPSYMTKYFGIELGSVTHMDDKTERYIVNGAHTADDLQNLLDGFIAKFVLCPACFNPETRLKVVGKKKQQKIDQQCVACGYHGELTSRHALMRFIVNNPPKGSEKEDAGKGKKGKKGKGKKRGSDADENDGDESPTSSAPISSSRDNVRQRTGGMVEAPEAVESEIIDDEWSEDTSAEAVRKREEAQLSGAVSKLVMAEDQDLPMSDRLDLLFKYVNERVNKVPFPASEVLGKAERLDCKEKGVMVLADVLLNDEDVVGRLKTHQGLLQRFTDENNKAQKYLLHGMEGVIDKHPALLTKVPVIFNALYDLDIVEEDAFLAWNEKVQQGRTDAHCDCGAVPIVNVLARLCNAALTVLTVYGCRFPRSTSPSSCPSRFTMLPLPL
eukprot:TRINITY_DN9086_c0_g1_i2.p1 TRINITY_DN9086_c0_g1~~TRINITY_DN9086_c0_g1_i2.p1  ORF type:complete len:432 (+),score=152.60 TRINITY_DN9086_c0_g1_i2:233-1528(+)